jgi:uncharacterized protein YqjF (DUF2071 family)
MWHCWDRLLFLHWRYPAAALQERLPPGLTIDTFDGDAWLGVVPFFMRNIRIRGVPPIPTASNFLELNLRTYVHDDDGVPGVWFLSLDADSLLTVLGARRWFHLPYHSARMQAAVDRRGTVDFRSRRSGAPRDLESRFLYSRVSNERVAAPGSLEFFLVERYVLFAAGSGGRLWRGRVWHEPYRIGDAQPQVWDANLVALNGLPAPARPPDHAVVAARVTVDVFGLTPVESPVAAPRLLLSSGAPVPAAAVGDAPARIPEGAAPAAARLLP